MVPACSYEETAVYRDLGVIRANLNSLAGGLGTFFSRVRAAVVAFKHVLSCLRVWVWVSLRKTGDGVLDIEL